MRKPATGCRGGRERSGPWQGAFMNACKRSKLGLLSLGLALVLGTSASAQQPAPRVGAAAAGDVGQKKVAFEMRGKPWPDVMAWLSKESGVPFYAGPANPTGTFTYVGPNGLEMKTISDAIDILNQALRPQKYIILRHNQALTVVPADEPVPTVDVPRLTNADELANHGNSELVSLVYHLKAMNADEFAPQIKKMMTTFGTVTTIAQTNTLVMQDDVATLKQIVAIIKEGENLDNRAGDNLTYRCEYIPARDAERKLKDLLGDPAKSPMEGMNPMMIPGMMPGGMPGAVAGMPIFMQDGTGMPGGDPNAGGRGRGRGNRGGPGGRGGPAAAETGIKSVVRAITSDEATNTVFVSGPADKLAMARIMLKNIDVGSEKYVIGPALMKTYSIPQGNAEAVAAMLTANFKDSNTVKITAIGNSSVLVYAYPADHFRISKDLETSKPAGGAIKIMLTTLDSNRVVDTLKAIYSSSDGKAGYPYIETDISDNAIIVKGSDEQIGEVKDIVKALGEQPAGAGGQGISSLKIITLEKGNAAALAEAIQKALEQLRQNPVNVINPNAKPATPPKEMKKGGGEEQDEPKTQTQLFDPQKKKDNLPGDKKLPITITAIGNKIIINSDDPQAMALAQELIRIYTQSPKGDTGFEIIHLKNAKAMDAAKILDDAFNGPKQQPGINLPGFNPGGGGGRGGGGGANFFAQMLQAQSTQAAAKPRIRVVADPATNSLLVQASPLDMLEIKHLLDKAIDSDDTDSNAVLKTWPPIVLKYADASEVLNTLQSVYREYMTSGGGAGFSNIGPNGITVGSRFSRGGAVDANGNPRSVSLTMGLDARSNSIVLQCSELMHKDVAKLIEELDAAAKDSTKTIKLIKITGVDPMLVQEAIDVIQGRRTQGSANNMNNGFGQGGQNGQRGGGIAGGGGQGFNGGGGQGFGGGGQGFGGGGQGFGGGGAGFGGGRGGAGFGGGPGGGGFGGGPGGGGFGGGAGGFGGGGAGGGGRGGAAGGGGGGRGGAGGGRGGLQRSQSNSPDGGPDFFEHGVKDDPQSFSLYDPRTDPTPTDLDMIRALAVGRAPEALAEELLAIAANEQQPAAAPAQNPAAKASDNLPAPRNGVTADVLPELGYIVISTQNPADAAAIEKIIQLIIDTSKGAEVNYKIFYLKYADATSVTATMNQLFSRVNVNSNGTGRIIQGAIQTNISTPGGNISAGQNNPAQNLVLLPLLRFNAIFVAAPQSRMQDIEIKLHDLDKPTAEISRAVPFPLKKASASRVATLVNTFYQSRGESQNVNQIRITEDDTTNTVFVQAAPADMEDIRRLIEHLDRSPTGAVNDLRIYHLRIALADELSNLLVSAIAQGVLSTGTTPTPAPAGGIGGGVGGGIGGGIGGIGGAAGAAARPATGGAAGSGTSVIAGAGGTPVTKNVALRFVGLAGTVDGLVLEDIHITPDLRTNSIIISAPERTMPMLFQLIQELDVAPSARAEIKVFPLKHADAYALETILQNLFFGTTTAVPGSGTVTNSSAGGTTTGAGAAPPAAGGGGGAGITGSGALGQSGPVPRSIVQLPGQPAEGAPLVELHITVDPRTNSLLVAGGRNELTVIEAIVIKLDEAPIAERMDEVVHIKNASAADVATALQNFIVAKLRIEVNTSLLNAYQEMLRDMIVIAEPFTNKLLISATPKYFGELMRLIKELDAQPPQVVIQVMIAEVDLSSTEEFGVEIGLQSPVLFQRGIFPNPTSGFGTGTTVSFANSSTDQVVGTASSTLNPFANPGFNFNASPNLPALGTNPLASPGVVGVQGVGNLGVGRADQNGLSGFVFSAASNSFNLLVRALKTQGRIDILSRPQIMTLDNQTATINIGQQIPYVGSTTLVAGGLSQQNIERVIVGVNLQVTPRITAEDGTVLMRVTPSVSSQVPTQINLGNGILATAFNVQQVDTTVQARDGETVCIGGLITKNETKNENKIPVLGDLPFFGALFRYRTQMRAKTELLVIMTPHIVHSKMDVERVLGEEARRMDWILMDVLRTHGTYGMDPAIPKKDPSGAQGGANCAPGLQLPGAEVEGPAPVPMTAPPSAPMGKLPGQPQAYNMPSQQFQPVSADSFGNGAAPSGYVQGAADNYLNNPAMAAPQGYPTQTQAPQGYPMQPQTQPSYQQQPQMPADPAPSQPASRWNLFGRQQ